VIGAPRVTLAVAAACVAASMLALAGVVLSHPMLAWMVHVDVQHLAVDLVTWTSFGAWLERRAGWRRMLLWVVAGLATSLTAHALVFPSHGTLYGLSAIAFFVFTAGLTAYAMDQWWGRAMMAGVVAVLVHEWVSGGTSAAEALVDLGFGATARMLPDVAAPEPVPGVHVACAVMGSAFGCVARLAGRWDQTASVAVAAPRKSYLISKP
jgi:membrane associated rhomboid family serine protease